MQKMALGEILDREFEQLRGEVAELRRALDELREQREAAKDRHLTVEQFAAEHPAYPEGMLRSLLFRSKDNGLEDSGAVLRDGRRIRLKESLLLDWLERRARGGRAPGGSRSRAAAPASRTGAPSRRSSNRPRS
jgi:hypothetical protein